MTFLFQIINCVSINYVDTANAQSWVSTYYSSSSAAEADLDVVGIAAMSKARKGDSGGRHPGSRLPATATPEGHLPKPR